jgi:hypothetical protein
MVDQLVAISAVAAYSLSFWCHPQGAGLTVGIRVRDDEEELGLDVTQHGERGYVFDDVGVPAYNVTAAPAPMPAPQSMPQADAGSA